MALEDAIGSAPDFSADSVLDRVSRGVLPDLPDNANADMVLNRLNRKLSISKPAEKETEKPETKNGKPDFSSQGTPIGDLPDLSSEGTPIEQMPQPAPPAPPLGVGGNLLAAAKGIPAGAAQSAGGILQGAGTAAANSQTTPVVAEAGLGNDMLNSPWALPGAANPEGLTPKQPVDQNALVKAGKAVKGLAPTMSDQEKESFGGKLGTMAGGIAPYALTTLLTGPLVGIPAAAAGMAADTYGNVYEEAKKHGAADDVAESAATRSAMVAGVLGAAPLGAGKYAKGLIGKVASSSAAFATAGEAQEAILQQIAKDYDPKAGYTLDQKRLIAELILGAGMGGLHHAFERKPGEPAAAEAPQPGAGTQQQPGPGIPPPGPDFTDVGGDAGGPTAGTGSWQRQQPPPGGASARGPGPEAEPPGAGPGPQSGPDTGGPGAGNAGTERNQRQQPPPGAEPGKPPPGTGEGKGPDFTMDAQTRAKMEKVMRTIDPTVDVSKMSDADLFNTLNDHLRDTSKTGYSAKPETPEEAAAREEAATARTQRETLIRKGWDPSWVNAMTPQQRRKAFDEAIRTGRSRPPPEGSNDEQTQNARHAETRGASPSGVRGVEGDQKPVQQPEGPVVQELRRAGDHDGSGVGGGLSGIHHGGGSQAEPGTDAGADQERSGLHPRERQVGDAARAGEQPAQERQSNGERSNTDVGNVGAGNQHDPGLALDSDISARDVSAGGSANAEAGTRESPIVPRTADDVVAAQPAEPTPAQAAADNYKQAHVELPHLGLSGKNSISIETGVGGERKGVDADGKPWSVTMEHAAYGKIKGTRGADGDHLDIFVGPHPTSPHVFVLDQLDASGKFDEHKVLAGYRTPIDALHAYANSYTDGAKDRIGGVTAFTPDQFKDWLKNGDHTKPLKEVGTAVPSPAAPKVAQEGGGTAPEPTASTTKTAESSGQNRPSGKVISEPLSLLQFIASKGGIAPHAELDALDLSGKHRVQLPGKKGFFGVVRPGGMDLDTMREAAEEAGYLKGEHNKTSTIRELLDAIDEEYNRGNRKTAEGEELATSKRERELAAEREQHERERDEAEYGAARAAIEEAGYSDIPTDLHHAAARLIVEEGMDPDSAVEQAALKLVAEDADYGVTPDDLDTIYGHGAHDEIRAGRASENGGPPASERSEGARSRESEEDREDIADVSDLGAESVQEQVAAHRDAIEEALGPDAEKVAQVDIGRAAEIMVERPGIDIAAAFGRAVIENAVRQKFLTALEAAKAYGPEVKDVLQSGSEGASSSGAPVEPERAASGEVGAGGAKETGVVPRGRKAGKQKAGAAGEGKGNEPAAAARAAVEPAASGKQAARNEAGNAVENKPAAEDAGNAEPVIERGADNKPQLVMPGAEKASEATMAKRAAAAPLKPKVAQKAADIGLFGDEMNQADLMDMVAKAPPKKDEFDDIFDSAMDEQFGAKPAAMSLDDVAQGLGALFGKKSGLSDSEPFSDDTYRAALPYFKAGVAHFTGGGADLTAMVRSLVKHLATSGMDADAIQQMKPYIRRFTEDVTAGRETINAPSSGGILESDRGEPTAENAVGEADVPAAAGPARSGAGQRGKAAGEGNERSSAGERVSQDYAPAVGAYGNLELPAREPDVEGSDTAARESERSADNGPEGLPFERTSDEQTIRNAQADADLGARRDRQRKAEGARVIPGDISNIAETLPMLFPEQHDDVLKAEQRYAKPDGHGMLFTNGTGTGKTYSGLGVIKRMAMQGKGNTLVVAPSQGILMDWVRSAKDLGLDLSILEDTQDKGKGFVGTTYANLGQNRTLADREWDMVVADEAHKLSSDQNGTETEALKTLRAITKHPDGLHERARMVLRSDWDKIDQLPEAKKAEAYAQYQKKADPLIAKWRAEERPKTLLMSATPFAYHKSLDYANGYLFEYGDEQGSRYNSGSGRDRFFMQHLGYRMRTNKLTQPEADVKQEVMERQLHEHLKKQGSLSGRALTVDKDYDRKFVLAHDAVGELIDRAMNFLTENEKFRPLYDVISKQFDYLTRMRLLEAMKAQSAIPFIKKSLALGRKVVVFHDYNEGGGISPFAVKPSGKGSSYQGGKNVEYDLGDLHDEFVRANPYVAHLDFSKYPSPINALTAAFPQALVYNGTVSNKHRNEAKRLFNDDNSGRDIIIVQSAAGEAGISLHDTTGKHQRTLLNLGMPIRPTTSIQQEGRIYRVGQASDAMFRYMNTGTDWERWTFAGKIADRAGTAENLALGDLARTIRQSFIDSFSNSGDYEPEAGEGTGGKALDKATTHSISEFEKAKTHYFAQAKVTGRRDQREGTDYYATPEPIGLKMVEFADIKPGEKVLEPSAGHGAISRYLPEDTMRTLVEPSSSLASRAALTSPGARVVVDRFENLDTGANKFDAIIMNPPFGSGGKTAIEHLEKAAKHLKNGGRIVALLPRGGAADKRMHAFMQSDAAKGLRTVADFYLPPVTFERAGTGIASFITVLEKQTDPEINDKNRQRYVSRSYFDVDKISDLFDRIEHADAGPRFEPKTKDVDAPTHGGISVGGIEFNLPPLSTGGEVYADLKSKVGREGFAKLARTAEANGGHYLKTLKSFRFPNLEARSKFLDAVANPPPEAEKPSAPSGVTFKTGETIHAKTKGKLFVATPDQRVERDVYDQMASAAKAQGGYYSSFKGNGAIPGFQFKSAEARQAFLDGMAGKGGLAEQRGPLQGPGEAAQSELLLRGVSTGNEAMIAYDQGGNEIWRSEGNAKYIDFGPQFLALINNPKNSIVVHHNHPTDRSLSDIDIGQLGRRGLRAVWAHGHFGGVYRAELTPDARSLLPIDPEYAAKKIRITHLRAGDILFRPLEAAYKAGIIDADRGNDVWGHLVNVAMRDAGIIDYQHNFDETALPKNITGLDKALKDATELARKAVFGDRGKNSEVAGRARSARHAGDVGASFDRGEIHARLARQITDRAARAQGNRREEAPTDEGIGGEQYRLLGPETRFASPFDRFRKQQNGAVSNRLKDLMASTSWNRFVERYQNLSEPVKRLNDAVEARMNGTLPDSNAFYQKKRLFPGKIGNETKEFESKFLDPLIDLLKTNDVTLPEVGNLLYARHAAERNREIHKINPALKGAGSGMTDAEAAKIIRDFGRPKLEAEIAKRVDAIREYVLRAMEAHGLESPETIKAWQAKYKNYVPLGGFEEVREDANESLGEPGKFNVRGKEVKQALGRSSKANNPLVNLLDQVYRTLERGKKNEYLQALDRALQGMHNSDPDALKGFAVRDHSKPKRVISNKTGLVHTIDTGGYANDPKAVAFKINGDTHYWVFTDRDLADAIKRMHADGLGIFQGLLDVQNKLKSLWTHYSPDFLVRHFLFRYPVEGTLNSFEQKATGDHAVSQYVKDAIPFVGTASRAIFASNAGIQHVNASVREMQKYWQEMKSAGGSMVFRQMRDTNLTKEHLHNKLSSISKSPLRSLKDKVHAMTEAMDTITNALDNSLRLAAYASARKQGKTPEKAALIARDATVDFQLVGKWKNAIGLVFPFGNVAIQTGARMTSAVARSRIMQGVFAGTMLMGFLSTMFNYLIGGKDKDDRYFMDKIPLWERRLNFTVLNPLHKDEKGRPVPYHIAMPYNWAFPMTIGSAFATMAFGTDPHRFRNMIGMMTKSGVEVMTPFGQEENKAAMLAPELARPFIHAYTNENYNAIPVHKEPTYQKGPNSESGRKTTGDGWKYIASAMNSAAGGDKNHQSALDFYPEDIRLMFDYALGTQRRMAENIINTGKNAVEGKAPDWSHVPLARVFMGTDYDAADRAHRFERRDQSEHPWKR